MVAVLVDVGGDRRFVRFRDGVEEKALSVWDSSVLGSEELQSRDLHRLVGRRLPPHRLVMLLSQS